MDARQRREYFGKLRKGVELIGDRWFLDENVESLGLRGEQEIENFNILIGSLAYVGGKNVLIYGNKGTGKTTWSEVISSVYSGMTQTLFDVLKIQGHPDQTKANMLARPDLGRLGEEGVVFQYSCYLPALTLDEFNRLTPGKQSIIMEYIRTGTVEELGKWLDREDKPAFFATCNHNGDGTYPLPSPTVDRFDISQEFFAFSAPYDDQLKEIKRNIRDDLGDRKAAREVLLQLARKDLAPQEKMKFMQEHAKKYRAEMRKRVGVEIPHLELLREGDDFGIPLTPHARTLLRCIHEELNRSGKYGENRASEKDKDRSDHTQPFAEWKIEEGSSRAYDSIEFFAQGLAGYLGHDEVDIEHIETIAPYCLAHRLAFREDYKVQFSSLKRQRGERESMDLARYLVKDMKANYDVVHRDVEEIDAFLSGKVNPEKRAELETQMRASASGPVPDHPLHTAYWKELRRKFKIRTPPPSGQAAITPLDVPEDQANP